MSAEESAKDGDAETSAKTEVAQMKKMMLETKVDGKKSVWAMTLETFGMADGKSKKSDIQVDTVEQGLELLNEYVAGKSEAGDTKWMDYVPLNEFNAKQDDFLMAFLKWAEKPDSKDETKTKVNVSKAHRRLDAYFEWMKENHEDLKEPLTKESIKEAAKIWDIQITYDEKEQFVWWIDLGALDKDAIKKLSNREHLRYIVWFSHFVMLDKKAQEHGAIIVEDLANMGFFKMATLVPTDLGAKMDRLTIGILPVRMKGIHVFGAARWMSLLMTLMKPFMGKKMRERMILVPRKTDIQKYCDDLVTRKNIPVKIFGLEGEAPRDAVFEQA